jgi:hypothetical protein
MKCLGLLLTTVASLTLTACDPISGTLQVVKSFTALVGSSNQNCTGDNYPCDIQKQPITVTPGNYSMTIDMLGRDTVQINLKSGRYPQIIELSVPPGKEIPSTGSISLTAQESGQPFDLVAHTNTDVQESAKTHGYEYCQISWQEQVCGPTGGGPNQPPQYHCWYETRYQPGEQEVEYFMRTTTQTMQAQISASGTAAGNYSGSRTANEKIYTYQSQCYPRRY